MFVHAVSTMHAGNPEQWISLIRFYYKIVVVVVAAAAAAAADVPSP